MYSYRKKTKCFRDQLAEKICFRASVSKKRPEMVTPSPPRTTESLITPFPTSKPSFTEKSAEMPTCECIEISQERMVSINRRIKFCVLNS